MPRGKVGTPEVGATNGEVFRPVWVAMSLKTTLAERRAVFYDKWLDRVLATYPADASTFFRRQKDPFANPVGMTLAHEIGVLVDLILAAPGSGDAERLGRETLGPPLTKIMKVRVIQDFKASEAIAFVFELKAIIRELTEDGAFTSADQMAELIDLETEIDEMALLAFDIYAECLRQLFQIRIDEVKRSVSGLVRRLNRAGDLPELVATPREDNQS